MIASAASFPTPSRDQVHADFMAAEPRIRRHARIYFRQVPCHHRKADCISEAVALAWKWWVRLIERGKDPSTFVSALATFAARHVQAGRKLCGIDHAKDVLSPTAQQRHSFTVSSLPQISTLNPNPLSEALTDNTQSPVPDQVIFRCDFFEWLNSHSQRNRDIAVEMARGEKTKTLARRFKVSPGRISQLRRDFHDDWERFTSDELMAG